MHGSCWRIPCSHKNRQGSFVEELGSKISNVSLVVSTSISFNMFLLLSPRGELNVEPALNRPKCWQQPVTVCLKTSSPWKVISTYGKHKIGGFFFEETLSPHNFQSAKTLSPIDTLEHSHNFAWRDLRMRRTQEMDLVPITASHPPILGQCGPATKLRWIPSSTAP